MNRREVFRRIDEERENQKQWEELDKHNNVADFLLYIEKYLNKAKLNNDPTCPEDSTPDIRKLVAVGVACLEKFGC